MLGIGLGMLVDLGEYRPVVTVGRKAAWRVTIIPAGRAHSNPPLSGSSISRDECSQDRPARSVPVVRKWSDLPNKGIHILHAETGGCFQTQIGRHATRELVARRNPTVRQSKVDTGLGVQCLKMD
jgi:hypothetical protein